MRSGLNGRRINRLAVNATYRERVFAEATATLAFANSGDPAVMPAIIPEAVALALSFDNLGSATVSPSSEGVATLELAMPAAGGVYGGASSAGVAEMALPLIVESTVLPVVSAEPSLAVIDFETQVSPLAIPAIPASYAATPAARLLDMGHRERLAVEGGRRELRAENARDEALAVEEEGREFEIADSRREIEVRRKRRLEP